MRDDYPFFNSMDGFYTRYELKKKYGNAIDFDECIGEYTYSYDLSILGLNSASKLKIGSFCSIAEGCKINLYGNHNKKNVSTYPFYSNSNFAWKFNDEERKSNALSVENKETVIGNDVWIGANVTIMGGVHIGDGAIIGANSVVAKDIPAYSIAVGNPVEIKGMRFTAEQIAELIRIKWWEWDEQKMFDNINKLNSENIDDFINEFKV